MTGPDPRAAWLRGQVVLVLLVPALAGLVSQPMGTLVAAGAVALLAAAAAVTVLVTTPAAVTVSVIEARLRAWGLAQGDIQRAEEPDRPGRPRPRAPGAVSAAPER